jgi:tetratricopeptide (TPR) repeat protein
VVVLAIALIVIFKPLQFQQKKLEKTIAILPPHNWESNDTTAIDGILQNVRDNLCILKDMKKVVPWLSVLQYRNKVTPASVIAKELKVNYIIKPVVRTINGKTYLSIPLIDGINDKLLRPANFEIDSNNITTVHQEILKEIVDELDISITSTEKGKIDKLITSNKKARDYYWKGIELLNLWNIGKKIDFQEAITCFENAVEYDNECAPAYAQLARTYFIYYYNGPYVISVMAGEKIFSKQINNYADKALRYDSESDLSLLAKAIYYKYEEDYEMAIFYLENALEYNPNSYLVIWYLCAVYIDLGDTEKFIEFALNAVNSDFPENKNSMGIGKEYIYLQLGKAYRKMGFFDEALMYINLGIESNPDHTGLINEKSQVIIDLYGDYEQSKKFLLDFTQKDSSNINANNFLALDFYILGDFTSALYYFNKNTKVRDIKNLHSNIWGPILSRLAAIYIAKGETEKAQDFIDACILWAEIRKPQQKNYMLIRIYSLKGEKAKAIEQMKICSQYNIPWYQIRLFTDEPIYDNIRELPEFKKILLEMERKWRERRDSIKVVYEKKGLL